ncbi:MAG: hypothetical protein WD623_01180 [Marinobacter sp.]|uniref:hypothetical protein n=1 Tax=Marinobacter sp. TaxID=50741 RepID=UPI0034A0A54E
MIPEKLIFLPLAPRHIETDFNKRRLISNARLEYGRQCCYERDRIQRQGEKRD